MCLYSTLIKTLEHFRLVIFGFLFQSYSLPVSYEMNNLKKNFVHLPNQQKLAYLAKHWYIKLIWIYMNLVLIVNRSVTFIYTYMYNMTNNSVSLLPFSKFTFRPQGSLSLYI